MREGDIPNCRVHSAWRTARSLTVSSLHTLPRARSSLSTALTALGCPVDTAGAGSDLISLLGTADLGIL
jgi:hypothetical protein